MGACAPLPTGLAHSILIALNAACLQLIREAAQLNKPVYPVYAWGTLQAAGEASGSLVGEASWDWSGSRRECRR